MKGIFFKEEVESAWVPCPGIARPAPASGPRSQGHLLAPPAPQAAAQGRGRLELE